MLSKLADLLNGAKYLITEQDHIDAEELGRIALDNWLETTTATRLSARLSRYGREVRLERVADLSNADYNLLIPNFKRGALGEVAMMQFLTSAGWWYEYNHNQRDQGSNWWDIEVWLGDNGEKLDIKMMGAADLRNFVSFNPFSKIATMYLAPSRVSLLACINDGAYIIPVMLVGQEALRNTLRVSKYEKRYTEKIGKLVSEILQDDQFERKIATVILTRLESTKKYLDNGLWILDPSFK